MSLAVGKGGGGGGGGGAEGEEGDNHGFSLVTSIASFER